MEEKNQLELLNEKIDLNKEILSTMPKNNEKNISKYESKIDELSIEYKEYKKDILKEMKKRYDKLTNVKKDKSILELEEKISKLDSILYLLNDMKTSYEKMELDRTIYKLSKFYKENLENINHEILIAIKKFKQVGVNVQLSDFDYSSCVNKYIKTLLEEEEKGNIDSENMKNKFEEIYWKCSDIIIHIELNLRRIYLKNENKIDKYFNNKKEEILKELNMDQKEIINKYFDLKKQLIEKVNTDKYTLLNKFISEELNIKEYSEGKVKSNCNKMISSEKSNDIEKNIEEIKNNVTKFLNSLYEYQNYFKLNFIVEDIQQKYNQKESYKNSYNTTKKEIENKEKQLKKLNRKISTQTIFKKKAEENKVQFLNLVSEIKDRYKQLDKDRVNNKIYSQLTDGSTINEILHLASSFYIYLIECISNKYPNSLLEEKEELIKDLEKFIRYPYNTIVNNITILEKKDIGLMIKDRYSLLNFNISKEDLQEENLDNLVSILNNIKIACNIKEVKMKQKDIENACELNKIIFSNSGDSK